MGLKEDYYEILQKEREWRRREMMYHSLCEVIPSFRKTYEERGCPKDYYKAIYIYTLAVPLPPEMQNLLREFIEMCPAGAWQMMVGGKGQQKCMLADRSVHILDSFEPGDEMFWFGSQKYVDLPYNLIEETGTLDSNYYDFNLYLFQDGFVSDSPVFWSKNGPLSSAKAFSGFLLNHLFSYNKYGKFDTNRRSG